MLSSALGVNERRRTPAAVGGPLGRLANPLRPTSGCASKFPLDGKATFNSWKWPERSLDAPRPPLAKAFVRLASKRTPAVQRLGRLGKSKVPRPRRLGRTPILHIIAGQTFNWLISCKSLARSLRRGLARPPPPACRLGVSKRALAAVAAPPRRQAYRLACFAPFSRRPPASRPPRASPSAARSRSSRGAPGFRGSSASSDGTREPLETS